MFDFDLMKITAERIQSGRTLSEALDVAEARRIYLSEEWTHPLPTIDLPIRLDLKGFHIRRYSTG